MVGLKNQRRAAARRWRTIASFSFFICGLGSIYWSLQSLEQLTKVPDCTHLVEEKQRELLRSQELEELAGFDQEVTELTGWHQLGQIQVEIQGGVAQPGVYWLEYGERLADLIKMAGGLTADADQERFSRQFVLSQKLSDEQKITIPVKQEAELDALLAQYCQANAVTTTQAVSGVEQTPHTQDQGEEAQIAPPSSSECVSINYASSTQLQTLSGVGEKTAELIISGRPYHKIADLLTVNGIGEATLEKLEPFICL